MKKCLLVVVLLSMFAAGLSCLAQDNAEASTPAANASAASASATRSAETRRSASDISFDFVLNVLPASLLIDADSKKFGISSGDTRVELSNVYLMPNINAGIGAELGDFYLEATAGAGIIVNENFRSFLVDAILAVQYEFTDSFKMGPHIGLIYYLDPSWLDSQDVEFSDDWGYFLGLQLSMGDRIMYLVSVDLVAASFDAKSDDPTWTADYDQAELTGLAVQFGVRGEF